MRILIMFCLVSCLCFSQNNFNENTDLIKPKPVFELGVGFPWLASIGGGVQMQQHKILLNIKSCLIYNEFSGSYHYYLTDNFSVGMGINRIKRTPLFNATKKNFTVLAPQLSYVLNSKNESHNKEIKLGFEISRNSNFGLTNSTEKTSFMPFVSIHVPINYKKDKSLKTSSKNPNKTITPVLESNELRNNKKDLIMFEESIQNNPDLVHKYSTFKKEPIESDFIISSKKMENAIYTAKSFLGTPYLFGGDDKNGIDCSGLFFVSFNKQGINIPRVAQDIARLGRFIFDESNLSRGDFVFFANTTSANKLITHMGLYLGDGDFIHGSSSGVMISKINDPYYWNDKFLFGKRILK